MIGVPTKDCIVAIFRITHFTFFQKVAALGDAWVIWRWWPSCSVEYLENRFHFHHFLQTLRDGFVRVSAVQECRVWEVHRLTRKVLGPEDIVPLKWIEYRVYGDLIIK